MRSYFFVRCWGPTSSYHGAKDIRRSLDKRDAKHAQNELLTVVLDGAGANKYPHSVVPQKLSSKVERPKKMALDNACMKLS